MAGNGSNAGKKKAGDSGGNGFLSTAVIVLGLLAIGWLAWSGSGGASRASLPDPAFVWTHQRWLVLAPIAELALGYLGLLALVIPATRRQLGARVGYAWGASDDFAPSDQDIGHAVHVLGWGLPREVQSSWRYPRAMASRVALIARPGGRVMIEVEVPAERAGSPIRTALGMDGTSLVPWEEALAAQPWGAEPPGPVVSVPVEEVPEGGH